MIYTVSDFLKSYDDCVRIIAGQGGIVRPVREVGILDYELIPGLKNKYQRTNFVSDQLVLSTFLYTKDDAYQIGEAVKYLVAQGTSGLVIKNVFHLQIPEAAIRYANARNFPLMVTTSDSFFFDRVIADIDAQANMLAQNAEVQQRIDSLRMLALPQRPDVSGVRSIAAQLNPSFREQCLALWVPRLSRFFAEDFLEIERLYRASELCKVGNLFASYDDGVLLIVTSDLEYDIDSDTIVQALLNDLHIQQQSISLGVSGIHYSIDELPIALIESQRCAALAVHRGGSIVRHDTLGTLSVLLASADTPTAQAFERRILEPLRVHDAESNGHLIETLFSYCESGFSVSATAGHLVQHPNTIRYRLEQIASLTGLSYKKPTDMEQLSLARQIALCNAVLP